MWTPKKRKFQFAQLWGFFGCQQFWECIEIFKLTGDVLLNFISQCFHVTFSSRSMCCTDWNAQTFLHLLISKKQIIFFERMVSEFSNISLIPSLHILSLFINFAPFISLLFHSGHSLPVLGGTFSTSDLSKGSLLNSEPFCGESAS